MSEGSKGKVGPDAGDGTHWVWGAENNTGSLRTLKRNNECLTSKKKKVWVMHQ